MGQMKVYFSKKLRVPRTRGTRGILENICIICPICPIQTEPSDASEITSAKIQKKEAKCKLFTNYFYPRRKKHENILQKSPRKPSEITAISCGNHGNFLRKSRQLLEEITATSEGNHGNF